MKKSEMDLATAAAGAISVCCLTAKASRKGAFHILNLLSNS